MKCLTSSSALQEHPLSLSQYSIQSKVVHVAKDIDSLNSTHQFCMKATLGECFSVFFVVPRYLVVIFFMIRVKLHRWTYSLVKRNYMLPTIPSSHRILIVRVKSKSESSSVKTQGLFKSEYMSESVSLHVSLHVSFA